MAIYLDEFLYRGKPDGSAGAYHVVLGSATVDAFGAPQLSLSGALTPEQASEKGFPLPAIIAAMNTDLLAANNALKAALAVLQQTGIVKASVAVAASETTITAEVTRAQAATPEK